MPAKRCVIVGSSPIVHAWTTRTGFVSIEWRTAAASPTRYIVGGALGSGVNEIITSNNAINWAQGNLSGYGCTPNTIRYINNTFFIAGSKLGGFPANTPMLMSADNGTTWIPPLNIFSGDYFGFAYGGGVYVVGDTGGGNAYSFDTQTWVAAAVQPTNGLKSIDYGAGLFVGVQGISGFTSQIYTSPDGNVWTLRLNIANTKFFRAVRFKNGVFIACGALATFYRSTDGLVWTDVSPTPGVGNVQHDVDYGNGVWISCGTFDSYISIDNGLTWTKFSIFPASQSAPLKGITFGGPSNLFVAGGVTLSPDDQNILTTP